VFEHFTDGARRVLVLAKDEARDMNDGSVAPEHLLLAMVREHEGVAAKALADSGVAHGRAREFVGGLDGERRESDADGQPLSKATMRIIERSVRISWAQADGGVGTEHLLVALLEERDETIESLLAAFDITPQEVVQRLDALLAGRSR
jgi:ATP-dependent Clp protease ATP-binding subunit ClpC